MQELSEFRKEYKLGSLTDDIVGDNPMSFFEQWLTQAIDAKLPEPNAMTVATVDKDGQPSQRIVLLKELDSYGFIFYTNLGSRKAKELLDNPKVSLHFPWHLLERQVRICGVAEKISRTDVAKYFLSRPRLSQLGAWASKQSSLISKRELLHAQFAQMKEKFANGNIPVPDFWGGYRVVPSQIEFWQGGENRLHDRIEFNKQHGKWCKQRLMP